MRASVSIPVFFQPKIVPAEKGKTIPNAGELAKPLNNKWATMGFSTTIPDQVTWGGGVVRGWGAALLCAWEQMWPGR